MTEYQPQLWENTPDMRPTRLDQPGKFGKDHPATSVNAATNTLNIKSFKSQRFKCLQALSLYGPMTCAEVSQRVGLSRNQAATRLGELREGLMVDYQYDESGKIVTRPTGPRDKGQVQKITDFGMNIVQKMEAAK